MLSNGVQAVLYVNNLSQSSCKRLSLLLYFYLNYITCTLYVNFLL